MSGFLIVILTLAIAIMMLLAGNLNYVRSDASNIDRPMIEAVAANLMETHRAAVTFVSMNQNRIPVSGNWSWSLSSQASVTCAGTYPTNSASGTCTAPATQYVAPAYLQNIYNWNSYYAGDGSGGATDIVVTYASSSAHTPASFTQNEIAAALRSYDMAGPGWYFGITSSGSPPTLLNAAGASLNLPTAIPGSVVGLATIIP